MIAFIDEHRDDYGVEPTCRVLPIAHPYYEHVAQRRDPSRLSRRVGRDQMLKREVVRVFAENFGVTACARRGDRCGAKASISPDAR